ncbi:zinc finger BED domain-containing protein 4-like [Corythoichthys intestinalis]|uniref:zinc finger BED domain-containing protein 4-like n=1 Tax=Corythoichthys intestinalis TaxID=161448 RepID=UPI0025A4F769|nr:zinc finger BED domain-containing protein 4-like [Corythoichthys intestinalis]
MSARALGGRKRRDDIWSHFHYNESQRRTECTVSVGDHGEMCGHKLGGKNTTNLKRHLKVRHPDIYSKIPEVKTPIENKNNTEQLPIPTAFQHFPTVSKYKSDSFEQRAKENALALWIGRTGLPASTVEDEDFILMMETIDKRLAIPKRSKINNLVDQIYEEEKQKYKERLTLARKITLGLDIWTKSGLKASFLAISACYFCIVENKAQHILLRLEQIAHPHSAECIKTCVDRCIDIWAIPKHKILTVITDNGSKTIAAFKDNEESDCTSSEDESTDMSDPEGIEVAEVSGEDHGFGALDICSIPCVVHTLQLVVNMIQKEISINRLLSKVRQLVKLFHKSSVCQFCQFKLVKDCPTRWSSTYLMISRLLQIKNSVVQVADGMNWDYLSPSEWQRLTALKDLLLPFAEHTQMLQSDTQSLSLVLPALLDLQGHLSEFPHTQGSNFKDLACLATKMKANMDNLFRRFLDPTYSTFSPLCTAACLLDPTVAPEALLENDDEQIQVLLEKAEDFIAQLVPPVREVEAEDIKLEEGEDDSKSEPQRKRPRFKYLRKSKRPSMSIFLTSRVREEIQHFKDQLSQATNHETGLEFWATQEDSIYPSLKPIAFDLLAMPASVSFAERAFSVIGDLGEVRQTRARAILERSAFLKLNKVR